MASNYFTIASKCIVWIVQFALVAMIPWYFYGPSIPFEDDELTLSQPHDQHELERAILTHLGLPQAQSDRKQKLQDAEIQSLGLSPDQLRAQRKIRNLEFDITLLKRRLEASGASLEQSKSAEHASCEHVKTLMSKLASVKTTAADERRKLLSEISSIKSTLSSLSITHTATDWELQATRTLLSQTSTREQHLLCKAHLTRQEMHITKAKSAKQDKLVANVEAIATELRKELLEKERTICVLQQHQKALERERSAKSNDDSDIQMQLSSMKEQLELARRKQSQLRHVLASTTRHKVMLENELLRIKRAPSANEGPAMHAKVVKEQKTDEDYDMIENEENAYDAEVINSDAGDREEETDAELDDFDEDEMPELITC